MKQWACDHACVSRETLERLAVYEELLLQWSGKINLVSRHDRNALWPRHFQDSLQLLHYIPAGTCRAVDLGSGAGFPGVVLAIASGISFVCVEADQRKAAFLREVTRATSAPVSVHAERIELAQVAPAPLVTARALAPLQQLLSLAARFIAPGGVALFPKGEAVDQELTGATAAWNMRIERFPSRTDTAATILRLSEVAHVPNHV